jgi:hypothetical protein
LASSDRRDIAPLLGKFFPLLTDASTSDDWHGFLNAMTGLEISLDTPNPDAFDQWRKALAAKGMPVWGITEQQEATIKAQGLALKALEDKRLADLGLTLATLATEAPNVTADQLLAAAQPKP